MTCYLDRTFCNGGAPTCAHFTSCPKALTPDHQRRARLIGLGISQYLSPTSMPCYVDPKRHDASVKTPPPHLPAAANRNAVKSEIRPVFKSTDVPEARWRELFEVRPLLDNPTIGKMLGCTDSTVGNVRRRMGYKGVPSGGAYHQKFFREDAEKIAAKRLPGERLFELANRLGMKRKVLYHYADKFRDLLPSNVNT
jgi:hypothetical protein